MGGDDFLVYPLEVTTMADYNPKAKKKKKKGKNPCKGKKCGPCKPKKK